MRVVIMRRNAFAVILPRNRIKVVVTPRKTSISCH